MDLSSLSFGGLLVFGIAAVLKEQILICFRVLSVYIKACFFGREYNLDNKYKTSDWCEAFNIGDGTWGLMEIVSYHLLFVRTKMRDNDGELHLRDIPILEWIASRSSRRRVSDSQLISIDNAGNKWPETNEKVKADFVIASELEGVERQVTTGEEIKALVGAVKDVLKDIARKSDTEEIKLLVAVKDEIEGVKKQLKEWESKRPVELGRVKANVTRLKAEVEELKAQQEKPAEKKKDTPVKEKK